MTLAVAVATESRRMAKRKGRPANPTKPGRRYPLGLRVGASIKARIDREARLSGRTQSQVAEALIDRALRDEWLLAEIRKLLPISDGR